MAVSVPLRGVGCFQFPACFGSRIWCFRPLAGCGLFRYEFETGRTDRGFPSPYGVWVVSKSELYHIWDYTGFPSPYGVWVVSTGRALRPRWQTFPPPYGVWVVSAKLHILFDTAGKRIVNFAVLLYHIGRWFINSKLRKPRSAVRSV